MSDSPVLIFGKKSYRHLPWLVLCLIVGVGSYLWYASEPVHAGSTAAGLATGLLAGAIILFEFMIWPRKAVRSMQRFCGVPIGSAQLWMRAHIWLGLLSLPLALLHSNFQLGGTFNAVFMVIFFIVIGSGVFGLAVQNYVPKLMLRRLPAETIYSAIPVVVDQMTADAEALVRAACGLRYQFKAEDNRAAAMVEPKRELVVVGSTRQHGHLRGRVLATQATVTEVSDPEGLQAAFESAVQPYLKSGKRGNRRLASVREAEAFFRDLKIQLGGDASFVVADLEAWCDQRRQFDAQATYQWLLHGWLVFHVAMSVAVVLMLLVHIVFALRYW